MFTLGTVPARMGNPVIWMGRLRPKRNRNLAPRPPACQRLPPAAFLWLLPRDTSWPRRVKHRAHTVISAG